MDVVSFAERWHRKERELDLEAVQLLAFDEAVLPREVGSCQGFNLQERPQRLWEAWGIPRDWSCEDRASLAPYLMIGFDGAGNPFCIDERDQTVWMLDHENRFHTRQFINSSVQQLAESLLARLGESNPERFRETVRVIDAAAMIPETFWWYEAAMMSGN